MNASFAASLFAALLLLAYSGADPSSSRALSRPSRACASLRASEEWSRASELFFARSASA
jgi:hypothetical protein